MNRDRAYRDTATAPHVHAKGQQVKKYSKVAAAEQQHRESNALRGGKKLAMLADIHLQMIGAESSISNTQQLETAVAGQR